MFRVVAICCRYAAFDPYLNGQHVHAVVEMRALCSTSVRGPSGYGPHLQRDRDLRRVAAERGVELGTRVDYETKDGSEAAPHVSYRVTSGQIEVKIALELLG